MRVAIDDDTDFMAGLAVLFNEITKSGLYDWERSAVIYRQNAEQRAVESAMYDFMEQTQQIALFSMSTWPAIPMIRICPMRLHFLAIDYRHYGAIRC